MFTNLPKSRGLVIPSDLLPSKTLFTQARYLDTIVSIFAILTRPVMIFPYCFSLN